MEIALNFFSARRTGLYLTDMIKRLYIHNFRCLENFELRLDKLSSALLIGKNGAGKTSVLMALELLQKIARGANRVGDLILPKDLTRGNGQAPLRFEIEVEIRSKVYTYTLAFELPVGFKELRVAEEKLTVDGKLAFTRELAQVRLTKLRDVETTFGIDWHLVALPIVQHSLIEDFRLWLANALVLRPVPSSARGDSETETLHPDPRMTNFGEWFSGLLLSEPSAYTRISSYLKELMPEFKSVKNPAMGRNSRSLFISFGMGEVDIELPFEDLSDGEKCFIIFSLVIAANDAYGPLLCFWDEPDNYLAPSEVGPSIMALRRAFRDKGQLLITSHNPEAIRRFSDENTLVLTRNSHLEPTIIRTVDEYRAKREFEGDVIDAIVRGDLL